MRHPRTLLLSIALLLVPACALAQARLHVYLRAFIPLNHSGNPGYVRAVLSKPGMFVIPSPIPGDTSCFLTDNRLFTEDVDASSRATTEFVLVVANGAASIEKAGGREIHRTSPSHRVDCQTGADLVPPKTASVSNMHIGAPAVADGIAQVVVDGRASNPLVTPSPDIQYGGTLTFDTSRNTLRFRGSVAVFPAYEAFAQLNGGKVVKLFQSPPAANTTARDLIDFGTGIKLQPVDQTVRLEEAFRWDGTWSGSCRIDGAELPTTLKIDSGGPPYSGQLTLSDPAAPLSLSVDNGNSENLARTIAFRVLYGGEQSGTLTCNHTTGRLQCTIVAIGGYVNGEEVVDSGQPCNLSRNP